MLKAYAEQAVGGYTVGGTGNDPTFTTVGSIPADGTVVGELAYVKININANSEVAGATGTIDYTLDTGANDATCSEDFTGATLQIKKEVANSLDNVFGATANGKPTDTLIYRVTVTNASGVTAGSVTITDAVPTYTTLVTDAFAAGIFAQADLNASGTPSDITALAGDADDNAVASGSAPNTAAGQPIIFYIGASNDGVGLTGGSLDDGDTVVITYKVTID